MSLTKKNSLALIEIPRREELTGYSGSATFQLIQEECEGRLRSWTRPGDQLRQMSPTRFLAVLKGVESDDERRLAEQKLHRLFEQPINVLDDDIPVTIHLGMVLLEDPKDLKQAIRQAGLALQTSRKNTSDQGALTEFNETTFSTREELLAALNQALELGEFHLSYQPKKHAGFQSLLGAEALLRWHRGGRLIVTDNLMGAIEQSAITRPLTWWLLKSAVAQLSNWQEAMSIEIRIPSLLIGDPDMVTVIADACELYQVSPARLIVDVHESFILQDEKPVLSALESLKSTGVKVSISDIGSAQLKAYPALRNLAKAFRMRNGSAPTSKEAVFPIDEIKLSPTLAKEDQPSRQNMSIIKTFVDLAREFSLKVACAGIESQKFSVAVAKLGCDVLQGPFIGPEMNRPEFEKTYPISVKNKAAVKPAGH